MKHIDSLKKNLKWSVWNTICETNGSTEDEKTRHNVETKYIMEIVALDHLLHKTS